MPTTDSRRSAAAALCGAADLTTEQIAAASGYAVVDLLSHWLTTRVVASRSLNDLRAKLVGQRLTRSQALTVVQRWLDAEAHLADDGLIEFDD